MTRARQSPSAWRRISCRPRARSGRRPAPTGWPPFSGQVLLAQRLELRVLRVQGAQIGIGGLQPSRPRRSPAAARAAAACDRGTCSRSRDRRGCRGRGARTSGWRGSARSRHRPARRGIARSRPAAVRAGSWNAEASRPQSSARRISADDGLGRRREAGRADPYRLLLAARVERGKRGTILAVRRRESAAAGRQPLGELPGEASLGWAAADRARCWCSGRSIGRLIRGRAARSPRVRRAAGRRRPIAGSASRPKIKEIDGRSLDSMLSPPHDATRRYRSRVAKARLGRAPARRRRVAPWSQVCTGALASEREKWLSVGGNIGEWPGAEAGNWCDDREVRIIALGWVGKRTSRSKSHQHIDFASVLQIAKFVPSLPQM